MHVAVKGDEKAILAAHVLQEQRWRGDRRLPELNVDQIGDQLSLAVDRAMTEGGIANYGLVALALKQTSGDNVETVFLLHAYRTTLSRLAVSRSVNTTEIRFGHRIPAVYKSIPGSQLLGPTYNHTHRLLDLTLLANDKAPSVQQVDGEAESTPHVLSLLTQRGLAKVEEDRDMPPDDITRVPLVYPCLHSLHLQQLTRGDEGYLLALAYSTQCDYNHNHPFAGKIRSGYVQVEIASEELGFSVNIDKLLLTECEMVNGFVAPQGEPPYFTRGYGLAFDMNECKVTTVVLVDRAPQAPDYDEEIAGSVQGEEFVLAHAGNVEATGSVSHLRLPHYVDFQVELALLKRLQRGSERD